MTRPKDIDDYDQETKQSTYFHERKIVEIEYGSDSKLPPDLDRPCYLFKDRDSSLLKMLV
jgi:hypothetical protein